MLDAARVGTILGQSFPELAVRDIRYFAAGWDFEVWEVANSEATLLFRFPFRDDCVAQVRRETKLLPELASGLPAAVPQPRYIASGCKDFPLPFFGYEKINGTPLSEASLTREQRITAGTELGRFLSALHAFDVLRASDLGVEWQDAASWRVKERAFWERCRQVSLSLLSDRELTEADQYFQGFLDDDKHFRFETRLLHADLGMEHVLVDEASGCLTGVIDFGDTEVGDPALDFAGMPEDIRAAALSSYALPLGEAFVQRVTHFWRCGPFHDVLFGLGDGGPEHVEAGLMGIRERLFRPPAVVSRGPLRAETDT